LDIPGVRYTEIVRVADVRHLHSLGRVKPGDRNHTVVTLAGPLRHCLVRGTLTVAGNVAHATHGETKSEILGSGDASVPNQRFTLHSSPLTYLSADTPTGVLSSLELRVDDVLWPQLPSLVALGPDDRGFYVRADDEQVSSVIGPNGRWGRRFPSGTENIRARYRAGIGKPGNVDPGTISLLATKPLGVKDVLNPVPATGGADPESSEGIRRNVAVRLRTLDRLVSVPDYADFARAFAGVGKSNADRLDVRGREEIVVTIAGADDIPIERDSDLRRNLLMALRRFGDPLVGVRVLVRERMVIRLELTVTIEPDRDWAKVGPNVESALLAALSFDQRELGQDVTGSEVLAIAHSVAGVRRCVIGTLTTVPAPVTPFTGRPAPRIVVHPARGGARAVPAQLAYLAPELPEFLVVTREG
jgi:predicted phage baseplate assembly protein